MIKIHKEMNFMKSNSAFAFHLGFRAFYHLFQVYLTLEKWVFICVTIALQKQGWFESMRREEKSSDVKSHRRRGSSCHVGG